MGSRVALVAGAVALVAGIAIAAVCAIQLNSTYFYDPNGPEGRLLELARSLVVVGIVLAFLGAGVLLLGLARRR